MRIALPLKGKASQIFAGPAFDAEKTICDYSNSAYEI